ncbi:MAG: hypothetical protein QOE83_2327 [Actinomycetota bacterium]|nr:hypothetical protein [Actinomycetota bacterium]
MLWWPFVAHGYRFGVGPDVPVYLWWARVGAANGLSVVAERPGAVALIDVLAGTLHLSVAAVVAALECALAASVGLGMAALLRGNAAVNKPGVGRGAALLAGLLSGLFAVHLAGGYISNLEMVVPFLGAALLLAHSERRHTIGAAILLAGSGLAHPLFGATGAVILAGAAAWAWRDGEQAESRRIALATGGAAAVTLAGMASMYLGPARLIVDTSKDGFLRRAGLDSTLVSDYRSRFIDRWTRYVQWLAIPLAVPGIRPLGGFRRRFLISWIAVTLVGMAVGFITGLFPPDRMVTFGFAIPALAGVGVVVVGRWLSSRSTWLAWVAAAAAVGVMASGSLMAFGRQPVYLSTDEVAQVTSAARLAAVTPPGTTLVFVVDAADGAAFLATRAANVIRAALPPQRVADAYIYVGTAQNLAGGRPTVRGDPQYDALSRLYFSDMPSTSDRVSFILTAFDATGATSVPPGFELRAPSVFASAPEELHIPANLEAAPEMRDPLVPSSPTGIIFATLAVIALLAVAGAGWASWAVRDPLDVCLSAPAFGTAVMVLAGVVLERLGLPLSGWVGPTVVSALSGAGGYVLAAVARAKRGSGSQAADAIHR